MEIGIHYSETGRKEGRKESAFWGKKYAKYQQGWDMPNTNRAGMPQNEVWQAVQKLVRIAPAVTNTNMPMVNINCSGLFITTASYVPSDNSILEHHSAICMYQNPLVTYWFHCISALQ